MIIYRYRPFNDDLSRNRLRDLILEKRHFLSTKDNFNDIYDCWGKIIEEPLHRESLDIIKKKHFLNDLDFAEMDDGDVCQKLQQQVNILLRDTGIICFMSSWNNLLAWAHYASNFNGVVLGFDYLRWDKTSDVNYGLRSRRLVKVNYSDHMVTQSELAQYVSEKPHDFEWITELFLARKARIWSYESEYRILTRKTAGLDYLAYNENSLCEVIFGPKMDNEDKARIVGWLNEACIRPVIYNCTVSETNYEILRHKA